MYLEVGRIVALMTARSLPNSLRFWPREGVVASSRDDVMDHPARDIGKAKVPALEAVGQAQMVQAELVQHRGVQVVSVDGLVGDAPADLV